MTDTQSLLYKLLYAAFVEIRSAAREHKPLIGISRLADTFHNIPLQIARVENGKGTFEEVLLDLEQRATRNECDKWLRAMTEELGKNDEPSKPKGS